MIQLKKVARVFSVTLSNPTGGAEVSIEAATGTIYDNDDEPTITVPDSITVNESDGYAMIPISLSHLTYQRVECIIQWSQNLQLVVDWISILLVLN